MAQELKNVVLTGAGGLLGKPTLHELLSSNKFNVTVLSRASSSATFPDGVRVIKSDYTEASLVEAFKGQDVVIVTITTTATEEQYPILTAAAKAGVKRVLPSEFGVNTTSKRAAEYCPVVVKKQKIQEHTRALVAQYPGFSYTSLSTGPFFDSGLQSGFLGVDFRAHTFDSIWDDGTRPFSATNVVSIARAIVSVLLHPAETSNRHVFVSNFEITQSQLLEVLERVTSAKFTVSHVKTADQIAESKEQLARGDMGGAIRNSILAATYEQAATGSDFKTEESANYLSELLGVPRLDLEEVVTTVVQGGKNRE